MAHFAPHRILFIYLTVTTVLLSCGRSDTSVPRPMAYPRIDLCDTVYTAASDFPIHFEVNTAATLIADTVAGSGQGLWFDVRYPSYRATVHCTLTAVSDTASRNAVLQNRAQRIALNISDHHAQITEMTTPYGYTARLYKSPYTTVTPLQFLAAASHHVVSGALMFDTLPQSPDSVMPVIEAIERDLIHAIANMY